MKVLMVAKLYWPWVGGVEKVVQQLAEGINTQANTNIRADQLLNQNKSAPIEADVLCCQPKGKRKTETINGVKVLKAKSFGIFWGMPVSFDFLRMFKKIVKDYDVIDFHHPFPLGDLALLLFRPKARLVVHYHSDIVRQKALNVFIAPLTRHTLKKANIIIVSNPNLIKTSPYLRQFKQKCQVIPFGVDLKILEAKDNNKIKSIKQKYGDFVLFAGRLNYYKGVDYLIKAMKGINTNLVIIGSGSEKKYLKELTKKLKISHRVFFLPLLPLKELKYFYHAASLFVLPSIFKTEAFGLVLIEAMACGTPVISTELDTGTSCVNVNGKTGFVVPPRNSKALNKAIKKILSDKKLAHKISHNCLLRVKEKFQEGLMIRKTSSTYIKMLNTEC